jgi:hypothetical protein
MKAKYSKTPPKGLNPNHRKEGKCFFSSVCIISRSRKPWSDGRLDPEITLRLYGTGSKNFACLWVRTEDDSRNGSGSAGGYGYHRPSAAADEAIRNAGFELSRSIAGVGEGAVRDALFAIAKLLKVKRPALVEAHP